MVGLGIGKGEVGLDKRMLGLGKQVFGLKRNFWVKKGCGWVMEGEAVPKCDGGRCEGMLTGYQLGAKTLLSSVLIFCAKNKNFLA